MGIRSGTGIGMGTRDWDWGGHCLGLPLSHSQPLPLPFPASPPFPTPCHSVLRSPTLRATRCSRCWPKWPRGCLVAPPPSESISSAPWWEQLLPLCFFARFSGKVLGVAFSLASWCFPGSSGRPSAPCWPSDQRFPPIP